MLANRSAAFGSGLAAVVWLVACAREPPPPSPRATAGAANPAARKCLDEGYRLEPVLADGVVVNHRCIDPATGRSCDAWEYFRGTCRLRDAQPTPS